MREPAEALEEVAREGTVVAINAISVAEVYSGLIERHRSLIEGLFGGFEYWHIPREVAEQAGNYRFEYAREGVQLSVTDTLLAAHAVSRDATLITANLRHFPMPELKVWYVPG